MRQKLSQCEALFSHQHTQIRHLRNELELLTTDCMHARQDRDRLALRYHYVHSELKHLRSRATARSRAYSQRMRKRTAEVNSYSIEQQYKRSDEVVERLLEAKKTQKRSEVGFCTSFVYSPVLQRHIGLARVQPDLATAGTEVHLEVALLHHNTTVRAHTTKLPFFNPDRKTSTP